MKGRTSKILGYSKHFRGHGWKNYALAGSAFFIFLGGIFFFWISTFKIPTLDSFEERKVVESTKIFDRSGEILLYDVNQDIKRTVIPFEHISRNLKNATIAIEDREFYEHKGVKPRSFLRAVLANIMSLNFSQGGSTITQQVVKNSLLSKEKKVSRKIKEWVLALKLEKVLTKDEIFSLYLNEIPYGGSLYGAEEASQAFFGKSASDLSIAEAAYLAAIPKAPTYYSPYGTHKTELDRRKNLVIEEMYKNGFITEEEKGVAISTEVAFKPKNTEGIKAPHFVFYVIEQLEKKYGEDTVRNGGLRVKTTLDFELQAWGEEIAKQYAIENKDKFNAENAAFVAINPKTGEILSMIGSRDYFDKDIDGNFNIATAHRQPGSTFKPFVYAEAFNKGYTPETVLFDVKTQFSTRCQPDNLSSDAPCYSPENYDNKYRGPITLRESLAQSINITSVKTLYLAGIKDSIDLAKKLGINSLGDPGKYGLTLVLGGGEVSLLEMASAYGVFANEGVRNQHTAILEVKDRSGKTLDEWKFEPKEVLARESALKVSSILSDNVARTPAFGQTSVLHFPTRQVAVKTGTTNDYRDAWIIGYTPDVVLGAWAGNNDNSPMEKRVAGFIVAPMWRAYMDKILSRTQNSSFPIPEKDDSFALKPVLRGKWQGETLFLVDSISGNLASEYTPHETTKEVLSGEVHTILYWLDKDNPRGDRPRNPENDPQFNNWEYGVRRWVETSGYIAPSAPTKPSGIDSVHGPQYSPRLSTSIIPQKNIPYDSGEQIKISVGVESRNPVLEVRYFINESLAFTDKSAPFEFTFTPNEFDYIQSENGIRVVVTDSVYNKSESVISFGVNLP